MFSIRSLIGTAAIVAAIGLPTVVQGASPDVHQTTIRVNDMHCSTCAKKIAAKLYRVSGVLEVRASVKHNTAYIKPQQQKTPSPREMWEAVEAAGFKPLELTGPAGKFTAKPQS